MFLLKTKLDVSSTPGSIHSQASFATQGTPLIAGTQNTPQVSGVRGTPFVSQTPLVSGTPRSPFPRGNPLNSPYLSQASSRTPASVSLRGDVGKRLSHVVNLPRVPAFLSTTTTSSSAPVANIPRAATRNEPTTPM